MVDYKIIGVRIKAIRKEKGHTQEALAERADLSVDHISHIETANTKMSLNVLVKIANALNVSIDRLLCDTVYQSKEYLLDEVSAVFADANPDETYVMLHVAAAAKKSMRTRKLIREE
jgi:transcriptional regulator with XRE-family HTH domain